MTDWPSALADLGWRGVLVALVVLVAAYALLVLWRMLRLYGRRPAAPAADSSEAARRNAVPPYLKEMAAADDEARGVTPADDGRLAWERPPVDFAERQVREGLAREVTALREELDALRGAFAALREEMRQELAAVKAQQTVSPFYHDAMQMALAGASADTIAGRCGIARGEAELVVALVHGRGDLNDNLGMEGGSDGGRPRV